MQISDSGGFLAHASICMGVDTPASSGRFGTPACWNTRAGCLSEKPMSISTSNRHERGGTTDESTFTDERLAMQAGVFAVDAEGRKHRYSRARDTVYVTRDGELEHVERLTGRDVDEWLAYVRFKVGLVDEWFHESLTAVDVAERLSDAVAAASGGE